MIDYYPDYDSIITALENELGSCQADILPAWIFCPGRTRSPTGAIDFANCGGESDLPSRFLFGQLVTGSFKRLPNGFSVRYASSYIDTLLVTHGDKLQFDVKIERSEPYFRVIHYSAINWNPGLIHQVTPTKPELDQGLKSVLESDFNVRYKCGALRKTLGDVCYVPDGYAVSILIPFPVNDETCSKLLRFVRAILDGPEIFCQAQLELQVIASNYREAQCPDLKLAPEELLVHDIDRDLIPYGIPEWEGEQEDRVLTIRRIGYILVIQTYLHDLGVILRYVDGWHLIQEGPISEQFAHIHDWRAEETLESSAGFSRDRSRRVVLGFTNPRPPLENRVLDNSFGSFTNKLQKTRERMEEIRQILVRKLAP